MNSPVGGGALTCHDCDILILGEDYVEQWTPGLDSVRVFLCDNCAQARWEAQEERKMEDQP
jgi:hypothetical protein